MIKYIPALAFTLLFITSGLQAQLQKDSLDQFLQDYARPDFKRVALDLRPSLSGRLSKNNGGFTNEKDHVSFSMRVNHTYVRNSERWQSLSSSILGMELESEEFVGTSLTLSPSFVVRNRYFFNSKKYLAMYNGGNGNYTFSNPLIIIQDRYIFSYNNFGIGFGRIEVVSDAVHMARVLDLLRCAGVLSKEIAIKDLEVLVDTVATMKNRRFFDSRIQQIREMTVISEMLTNMGYINNLDFLTFAVLSDAYRNEQAYGAFESGSAFEILAGRDFSYFQDIGWGSADDARLTLQWEQNKVKSQYLGTKWNIGTALSYRHAPEVSGGQKRYGNRTFVGYNLTYAPTNRIVLQMYNSASFTYDLRTRELAESFTVQSFHFSSYAVLDYYFSPQLRLSTNVLVFVRDYDIGNQPSDRDLTFGVSLLYSYF